MAIVFPQWSVSTGASFFKQTCITFLSSLFTEDAMRRDTNAPSLGARRFRDLFRHAAFGGLCHFLIVFLIIFDQKWVQRIMDVRPGKHHFSVQKRIRDETSIFHGFSKPFW